MKKLLAVIWRALHGPQLLPTYCVFFEPPPEYKVLWQQVLDGCGRFASKQYDDVFEHAVWKWIMVLRSNCPQRAAANTDTVGRTITVAYPFVRRDEVIKHELVHALQALHPDDLIGPNGDMHWPQLFASLGLPVAL